MGWITGIRGLLRRTAWVTAGAVLALGAFGFAIGGWSGARGGVLWGLMAGLMSIPAMLSGLVDVSGGGVSQELRDEWAKREFE